MRACFAVICTSLATLSACVGPTGCGWTNTYPGIKATRTATLPVAAADPLNVRTENGSVDVRQGGTEITVVATLSGSTQARVDSMNFSLTRGDDGLIRIAPVWAQGGRTGNEGCSFVITMPEVSSVDIGATNGGISIGALAGDATLVTTNGGISVDGPARAVKAKSTNGSIKLVNVQSANADTSNASISITLTDDATGPVLADTSNGAITFMPGKAFAGRVDVSTSNGSVRATGTTITKNLTQGAKSGTIYFGGLDTPASKLDTSNASITITGK
jgi:DUF4097 and DUF4098 domain-containing protein YvlB